MGVARCLLILLENHLMPYMESSKASEENVDLI